MVKFGFAGACDEFFKSGFSGTADIPKWAKTHGLDAFEYSCGHGVRMGEKTARELSKEFFKYGVEVSLHAPYFINLATSEREKQEKNIGYFLNSLKVLKALGGERLVFHPGALVGNTRGRAMSILKQNFYEVLTAVTDYADLKICAETMGKISQIGTVAEIVEIVNMGKNVLPCLDFGHINAFSNGVLKTKDDFRRVLDEIFSGVGDEKAKNMHIHFSKIMYGQKGEIKHLTFADQKYGPDFEIFLETIYEYKMSPVIICESNGSQTRDAVTMQKYFRGIK